MFAQCASDAPNDVQALTRRLPLAGRTQPSIVSINWVQPNTGNMVNQDVENVAMKEDRSEASARSNEGTCESFWLSGNIRILNIVDGFP